MWSPHPSNEFQGPLFVPVDSELVNSPPNPNIFGGGRLHPKQPINLPSGVSTNNPPGTNKWYTQLILPPRGTDPIYPLPYALALLDGQSLLSTQNAIPYVGFGISHSATKDIVFGPPVSTGASQPVKYYLNPLVITMCFGARELDTRNLTPTLTDWSELVAHFTISCANNSMISIPICRGAAFMTMIYTGLTPIIRSTLAIVRLTQDQTNIHGFIKYRIQYNDQSTWLLYAQPVNGFPHLNLQQVNQTEMAHSMGIWSGIIQVVKMSESYSSPSSSSDQCLQEESVYDRGVGVWVHKASISSGPRGSGSYSFDWFSQGPRAHAQAPLIFALPHHSEAMLRPVETKPPISIASRVNGHMRLYQSSQWTFRENLRLAKNLGITPIYENDSSSPLAQSCKTTLTDIFIKELDVDFEAEANLDSYYFAGKKFAKQALQCLTAARILKDDDLTSICLEKAKRSFLRFVRGPHRASRLVYDQTWKGLISSSIFKTGNEYDDFGNGVYNDHHFHFSYLIHAAAILVHLDPTLFPEVGLYINNLIRDINNPTAHDRFFPLFRCFDWFLGHSLATGLTPSFDGKNQESCSEDIKTHAVTLDSFLYSLKAWAEATHNDTLQDLVELQLMILRRSINNYYLMKDDNSLIPTSFKANKVPGILFENKADYTTFFSDSRDAIHMIQVIPITLATPFFRSKDFIEEEWRSTGGGGTPMSEIAQSFANGYRTLLFLQYGLVNPKFVLETFLKRVTSGQEIPLDDGLSLSWALGFLITQLYNGS
ncbi:family 81 glycoside hydrolase [Melampsora larici-populina 98AG31]|uniref:glucan endo-1,3-beta-D-glucosidase n=1 Tax=Melampsora larici-populina (strain 98AG31 / pathotype 3-4-7) TaxID=747676 RepID=F4RP19_MELLP|nr:family 81 glycoside hydrolase [Melampsora larici-populina 98AG31]EGG05744.1 family 81 glycoside hydrolase [Melampsora larici-populina 98AG31]